MRNIEIKAKVNFEEAIRIARELTDEYSVFTQTDTFFKAPNGRLKLRQESTGSLQLIFYNREDQASSKVSDYKILEIGAIQPGCEISEVKVRTLDFLQAVFGENIGIVSKKRHLFLYRVDDIVTRIHLDEVEGLGNFMELETIVQYSVKEEACKMVHNNLVQTFHIQPENVIAGSYRDMKET